MKYCSKNNQSNCAALINVLNPTYLQYYNEDVHGHISNNYSDASILKCADVKI